MLIESIPPDSFHAAITGVTGSGYNPGIVVPLETAVVWYRFYMLTLVLATPIIDSIAFRQAHQARER